MSKQKILTYLYFTLLVLDVFGIVYPEIIYRKYVTFLPFPILMLLYFVSLKKMNWLYTIALFSTFLGILFFKLSMHFKIALIFYGIGVCIYVVLALKTAIVIPTQTIFKATIPFLIVYLVPLFLYYEAVNFEIFNYILFYVFFVGLFVFISVLIYIHQQNRTNLWLFSSGIIFLISTIIHGYHLFIEQLDVLRVGIVITFLIMHYTMYRYVILQQINAMSQNQPKVHSK
ncbi:hypothetical protein KORDIASMS9_03215 [Kordia sp. SMS9]|uniref:hypothetical protein n=1 Tax=Kordia sp. SMS9 TaxID=2282170 RepID=UPI000E103DC6|nr:hypothetical protein [Kordia sp. SMS9]AXG70960.1 hypothetical protein KORDIASMS9_03215 [Kordia sp. SMS9]